MAKRRKWQDEYWLMLMQIYLQQPVGIKPVYSSSMVNLGLELHIPPQVLMAKMQQIATLDTPRVERFWKAYSGSPWKLARAVKLLREMKGFGRADEFYDGVEVNETWEKDWQPLDDHIRLTPVMLTLVLDMYFRLTPATMVKETPEVQELAKHLKVSSGDVVEALAAYQCCDPYLRSGHFASSARRRATLPPVLLQACQTLWQRYGNGDTETLAALAEQLATYYRKEE